MLRESLVYILSRAVPSGIAFVTGMVLTWLLTPADYGVYGLGMALIALIAATFFDWHGLSFLRFYQSEVARPTYMPTILQLFLLLCLASIVVAVLAYATGTLTPDYRELVWICVPGCWCYAWFELAVRMQIAQFRPAQYFWMNLVRNVGILVVVVAHAWATGSPFYVLAGSFVVMLLAGVLFLHPGFSLSPRFFDRDIAGRLWAFGWPVAVGRVIGTFSFAADRFLLDEFSDKASVGFYTVAFSLAQMTIATIATGIDSAIYSRAVKVADRNDPEALRQQLSKSCALMLAVTLPASVGVAMVAPGLARLAVAPDYVQPVSTLIVWMSAAAFLLQFRANYVDHGFHLGNTTGRLTWVITVMAIVNLVGDLILIPRYGAVGAAQASIIAGVVAMIHGIVAARSSIVLPFPKGEIAKIAIATLAMGLFLWPFSVLVPENLGRGIGILFVQVVGGAAVFGLVALGVNVLNLRPLVIARLRALRAG
jgi:O-antigen/teichoic acid export membrane protein